MTHEWHKNNNASSLNAYDALHMKQAKSDYSHLTVVQ